MAKVTNPNPIQKLRNLVMGDLDKLKARLVTAEDEAAVAKEALILAENETIRLDREKSAAVEKMQAAQETETEAIRRATEAEEALAEIQQQVGLLVGEPADDEAVPDTENVNDNRRRR